MKRMALVVVITVLAGVVAFSKFDTVLFPGRFEAKFPTLGSGAYPQPTLVLQDNTGLVLDVGVGSELAPTHVDARNLVLGWMGGCNEGLVTLTMNGVGGRVVVDKQVVSNGCPWLIGLERTVVLRLRQPLDPSLVDFEASLAKVQQAMARPR